MTASFSKNINLLNLFVYYPLDCHAVSPFLQHVLSLLQFLILEIITVLRKIKKKSGGNKNKFGTTNSKNHENFKNIKPRVQFYWFLYEKSVTPVNGCFLKLFTGFKIVLQNIEESGTVHLLNFTLKRKCYRCALIGIFQNIPDNS